jgi:hypothetical protein
MRVVRVTLGHESAAVRGSLPNLLAFTAIISQDRLHLILVIGGGQEYATIPG